MRKGFFLLMIVMIISTVIALLWDKISFVRNAVHSVLNPTFGYILNINLVIGFLFITFLITLITTLLQKYTTDQEALKQLKEDQKKSQEEMKMHSHDPGKVMELQKKQFENFPKTFDLTMKPLLYTAIPFILLLRWFSDIFKNLGDPKFFGFLGWIWFYIIFSLIFNIILRKILKVY